jgi:FeS assembly protein IscX
MPLIWTDTYDIAIELEEKHPTVDIQHVRFTDLWKMVQDLPTFEADPDACSEKILEAIQAAWLDERD